MPEKRYFELPEPIIYRGKKYYELNIDGFPFEGETSVFEEFRKKVDFNLIDVGDPKVALDKSLISDLTAESLAYDILSNILIDSDDYLFNLRKSVEYLDMNRRIYHYIIKQMRHTSNDDSGQLLKMVKEVKLMKAYEFPLLDISLLHILMIYAYSERNYDWIEQIYQEIGTKIKNNGLLLKNLGFDTKNIIFKLDSFLNDINEIRKEDQNQHNLKPDYSPHPESIKGLIEYYKSVRNSKMLQELEEIKQNLAIDLLSKDLNPITHWVGQIVLTEFVPAEHKLECDKDRIDFFDKKGKPVISVSYKDDGSYPSLDNPPKIDVYDYETYRRIFGLANEDRTVLRFNRFKSMENIFLYG